MEFRVLGPLEADHRGDPVDLGSPKQREVLSFLLMHPGRPVPAERILDAVWGESDGQNPLYIAVSRLRSAFAEAGNGDVLTTRSKAYALEIAPESVDAVRFERLVTGAMDKPPDGAKADLEEALGLWRGPAWDEVRYREFAVAEAERLEELRAGAVEDLLDLRLTSGETTSVVADAKSHHQAHPLRERPVELLMVALYRSGRQAEALRTFSEFARTLDEELGVEPSPHLRSVEEQILLHDPVVQSTEVRRVREANPYQGLRPFHERDAGRFFGRDRIVTETLDRLRSGATLVTLVGASGSGKSSIARAGVVPAVRTGALEGCGEWLVATMLPGAHPFAELEAALIQASGHVRLGRVDRTETAILQGALTACGPDRRLLLVIDQFEELFTLAGPEIREQFLTALRAAVDDSRGRVVVLATLRADHYALPLEYPLFADRFGRGVVNVGPLLPAELELAAVEPARGSGFGIDPALLATIVADVAGQAGALPLFQYTLTHLADTADGTLTAEAYADVGGIAGALTTRADDVFARFELGQQDACRQLFLRMVAIGSDGVWTRRRLPLAEARGLGLDDESLQAVVAELVAARLVTTDRDAIDGSPTIEVAHESLLTGWWRLAEWLGEAAEDIKRHRGLSLAVAAWLDAGMDDSYLWKGRRLAKQAEWAAASAVDLSDDEKRFLNASQVVEIVEQERADVVARSSRIRALGLLAAIVGLVAVGGYAIWQGLAPDPVELVVLDGAGPEAVSAFFDEGIEEVGDRLGMAGVRVRPGVDSGADIEAAVQGGASRIAVSRDALGAFPPTYWDDLGSRVVGSHFFDLSFVPVAPSGDPSWTRVTFREEEAAFIAGAIAAIRSETGVIGHVGAHSGHLSRVRAGFEAGATFADPSVEVVSATTPLTGSLADAYLPEAADRAYQTTWSLLAEGADVVLHTHGDAELGVVEAVVEANAIRPTWIIGHDGDLYAELTDRDPEAAAFVLMSVVRRYDKALFLSIERSRSEKEPFFDVGLADGGLELTDHGGLDQEEVELMAELVDGFRSGRSADMARLIPVGRFDEQLGISPRPQHAPTIVPDGAAVIDATVVSDDVVFEVPSGIGTDDVVVVTATRDTLVQTDMAFVAIGRILPGADLTEVPDSLTGPVWEQPGPFDVRAGHDWAVLPNRGRGSASASVIVDEPGTWAVAVGWFVSWYEVPELVEWMFFEVDG